MSRCGRYTIATLVVTSLVACAGGARGGRAHVLALGTGDDDAAVGAWADAIDHDCGDRVAGIIPAGTIRIRTRPWIEIRSECANPHRTVEIAGRAMDSTVVRVESTIGEASGLGFIIGDPQVHIHDLTLIGNGDLVTTDDGAGNTGQGIKYRSSRAAFGEADHLHIVNFANAGIDIYRAPAVAVHDNVIECTSGGTAARLPAMGIWARELEADSVGRSNARVTRNRVSNCGAEGITATEVRQVIIGENWIACPAGGCVIGIALYSEPDTRCDTMPVSDNVIAGNTIDGGGRITVGIILRGSGAGHHNRIDGNIVRGASRHGIQIAATECGPGDHSAFADNQIMRNDVADAADTQIWSGGARTIVTGNRVHVGGGLRAIEDASRSSQVRDNAPY